MKDRSGHIDRHLANRVSQLRKGSGLTLNELAAQSGVSRSMVSLIERGESSPTANVLDKLAGALGVPLAILFADEDKAEAAPVSRGSEQRVWRDPDTGYLRRNLSPAAFPSPIELVEVILPPKTSVRYDTGFRVAAHDQQLWVLEGTLEVHVGPESYSLRPRDCLAMRVGGPTSYRNRGNKRTRYLIAVSAGGRSLTGGRS